MLLLLFLLPPPPGLSSSSFPDCVVVVDLDFFFLLGIWWKREFKKLASLPPGELGCLYFFFSFSACFSITWVCEGIEFRTGKSRLILPPDLQPCCLSSLCNFCAKVKPLWPPETWAAAEKYLAASKTSSSPESFRRWDCFLWVLFRSEAPVPDMAWRSRRLWVKRVWKLFQSCGNMCYIGRY